MIIVCRKLQTVKKRERLIVVYACRVCCGSKNIKLSYFDRLCSLSIRRFWGKGERWKRKREGAEGEKLSLLPLPLPHLKSPLPYSLRKAWYADYRLWYHLKKVSQLAPYLWLVTYWQLTLSDLQFRKWWAEDKNTGSYSRRSLPFSPSLWTGSLFGEKKIASKGKGKRVIKTRATCRPKSRCQSDLTTVSVLANKNLHQDLMHS